MRIVNPELLKSFRTAGRCEWCGKSCRVREPAHVVAKGIGAASQLDCRINLVALGSTLAFECPCHRRSHDGFRPRACDLDAVIAAREHCLQDDLRAVRWWLLRQDKDDREFDMAELNHAQKRLAEKTLMEAGLASEINMERP